MVRIFTDSTSDMGPDLARQRGIQVIPLVVNLGERSFRDGVDLDAARLFELIDRVNELPRTSAPSLGDFVTAFAGDEEGIFIGISSKLSGTVSQAKIAAGETGGKIRVIDSLTLSSAVALLALRAADLRDAGYGTDAIVREITASLPKVRMSFALETLKYLYLGGRCTALQSFLSSMLSMRLILTCAPDGTLGIKDKIRGTRRRAIAALLNDFSAHLTEIDLHRVFVTHSACAQDATDLAQALSTLALIDELLVTEAGTVVSSHCGPGTIGILYMVR